MMTPIFLLGRPGAGKSTVCRYLSRAMPAQHLTGFPMLQALFRQEATRHYFLPHERYEFVVKHDVVYKQMEQQMAVQASLLFDEPQGLLLIELVQGNYQESILRFDEEIRRHAYALYLDMPLALCMERIAARVASDEDDRHEPPPEFIARHCVEQHLPGPDVIAPERLIRLDNTGGCSRLYAQLDRFLETLKGTRHTYVQSTERLEEFALQAVQTNPAN